MLGQDGQAVRRHVGEAAAHVEDGARRRRCARVTGPSFSAVMNGAWPARTPKSPSAPGASTWSTSAGEQLALRRDQGEVQLAGHALSASAAIFSALATASSMVPTM